MFTVFDALSLLCGLALFLYGMQVMSDGLKKSAGTKLKSFLDKMTSSPVRGFFLGLAVTAVVQSEARVVGSDFGNSRRRNTDVHKAR